MNTSSFQNEYLVFLFVLLRWILAKEEERKECQQDTETFQTIAIFKLSLKLNCNLFIQEFIALKKIVHAFLLSFF